MPNRFCKSLLLLSLTLTLVHLSAPGAQYSWLALIWPLPLIIATRSATPFKSACTFGGCLWLIWLHSVWWLLPAIMDFAGTTWLISSLLLLVVTLSCALPYALAAYLWRHIASRTSGFTVILPAAIFTVTLSWLPSLLPGSPFHGLYRLPITIQTLSLGGMPLLLFILLALNFSLCNAFYGFYRQDQQKYRGLIAPTLITLVLFGYGAIELHELNNTKNKHTLHVGFIQPNLTRTDSTAVLFDKTQQLISATSNIDLIVWPEFPPAFSVIDNPLDNQNVLTLSRTIKTPLLINSGYVYLRDDNNQRLDGYYNSNQLILNGTVVDSYHKQILVPFFEYLPFTNYWPELKNHFPETLNYQPGESSKLLALNNETLLITTICYEVIFSSLLREFIEAGGNIIINPVSDSWFGDSQASAHHFALALFKTVEFRVPLVRAANSGISAIVTAGGEIMTNSETPLLTTAVRSSDIFIPHQRSFYARNGDIFLYFVSAFLILYGTNLLRKSSR